ncbi:MAG TPA: hypothetical protein VKQ36_07045 [Ktedonobacterales bacterium]|nr:hypothetical protein [Ktedonobacterales bacterium]
MDLHFERGDPDRPSGHGILFARTGAGARILATYCVILPIQFSIGKYLPPMLAGQIPVEAMSGEASLNAIPIPPMLEEVPGVEALRQLAEQRNDDLCDMGTLLIDDESQRLAYAAEASATYGRAYLLYQQRWPDVPSGAATLSSSEDDVATLDDFDIDAVADSMLSERDRLGEIARLISQARYAMEGSDQRQLTEVSARLNRLASSLPEKYHADQLANAALSHDPKGPQLAALYLQRAYKLLEEDYINIPPIEQQIRELRDQEQ